MNRTAIVLSAVLLLCVLAPVHAGPIELIEGISGPLLQEYTAPLAHAYGVAMTSGLYHTAHAHKFLGFDIGVRVMYVLIPEEAKTFTARVLACSVNTGLGRIDTFYIEVDSAATIFGAKGADSSFRPVNGIAVPPALPGGLGLSGMPFLVPQASIGLPIPGAELLIRGVPYKFQGADLLFLGGGLTEELTAIPGLKLPFNVAVQGFYQVLTIGDAVDARSYGANVHISKSLLLFAPYAGVGLGVCRRTSFWRRATTTGCGHALDGCQQVVGRARRAGVFRQTPRQKHHAVQVRLQVQCARQHRPGDAPARHEAHDFAG